MCHSSVPQLTWELHTACEHDLSSTYLHSCAATVCASLGKGHTCTAVECKVETPTTAVVNTYQTATLAALLHEEDKNTMLVCHTGNGYHTPVTQPNIECMTSRSYCNTTHMNGVKCSAMHTINCTAALHTRLHTIYYVQSALAITCT